MLSSVYPNFARLYLHRCWALASHRLILLFFPPRKLTLECSQPLCERILTRSTEAVTLLLRNDLHAKLLAFRDRVKFDRVDDARERKDENGSILFIALVEGKLLRPQYRPDALPLPHPPFALQEEEVAMPDNFFIVLLLQMEAARLARIPCGGFPWPFLGDWRCVWGRMVLDGLPLFAIDERTKCALLLQRVALRGV